MPASTRIHSAGVVFARIEHASVGISPIHQTEVPLLMPDRTYQSVADLPGIAVGEDQSAGLFGSNLHAAFAVLQIYQALLLA